MNVLFRPDLKSYFTQSCGNQRLQNNADMNLHFVAIKVLKLYENVCCVLIKSHITCHTDKTAVSIKFFTAAIFLPQLPTALFLKVHFNLMHAPHLSESALGNILHKKSLKVSSTA